MNKIELEAGLPMTPGYEYARRVGNQLYVAGQVPHDPSGEIVGKNDPYKQARQCFANLILLLRCHAFEREDIQHLTIYVVGGKNSLSKAWRAVKEEFADVVPPATLLGVALLGHEEQLVEIEATVVKTMGAGA